MTAVVDIDAMHATVEQLRQDVQDLVKRIERLEPTCYCSFCAKSQHEVRALIAGPKVFICDECTKLALETLDQKQGGVAHVR